MPTGEEEGGSRKAGSSRFPLSPRVTVSVPDTLITLAFLLQSPTFVNGVTYGQR